MHRFDSDRRDHRARRQIRNCRLFPKQKLASSNLAERITGPCERIALRLLIASLQVRLLSGRPRSRSSTAELLLGMQRARVQFSAGAPVGIGVAQTCAVWDRVSRVELPHPQPSLCIVYRTTRNASNVEYRVQFLVQRPLRCQLAGKLQHSECCHLRSNRSIAATGPKLKWTQHPTFNRDIASSSLAGPPPYPVRLMASRKSLKLAIVWFESTTGCQRPTPNAQRTNARAIDS